MSRERMAAIRRAAESAFIRNQYGLWCPNCDERIDELWPVSCDHCGYPDKDHDRFDDDDDYPCTDCGDTGITFQTERPCACQPDPSLEKTHDHR